jgi:16S rRNA (cytosine967-C5)-methyltransferase
VTARPAPRHAEGAASRRTALEALARIEDDGAYANIVLPAVLERSGLSVQDRGLVTDLVYGTIRRLRSVDHLVDRFLTSDPPPAARRALRLGAYQLAFRRDIPSYAAVAATVEAAPKRFRALTNAVLRKVSDAPVEFPDVATRLSYPDWVVDRLVTDLGSADALDALEAMDRSPEVTRREDGYVQDRASQWVAASVGAGDGDVVVDLCAAPGGKATAMGGAVGSAGIVVAADLQPTRLGLVADNIARLGLSDVVAVVADATSPPFRPLGADRVLVDAPCSGLGVLRRRPDARWRIDADAPERLAALACRIMEQAVGLVRPGGTLVYSVCTLTAAETLGVDDHVARDHPALVPLSPPDAPWRPWGRGAILLPQWADTDGMCLFRYRVPD